jgi:hypothetical protein
VPSLIAVPLPPGKNPFADKININKINNSILTNEVCGFSPRVNYTERQTTACRRS